MLLIHLPDGPTTFFRMSNVKITPELKVSLCLPYQIVILVKIGNFLQNNTLCNSCI